MYKYMEKENTKRVYREYIQIKKPNYIYLQLYSARNLKKKKEQLEGSYISLHPGLWIKKKTKKPPQKTKNHFQP